MTKKTEFDLKEFKKEARAKNKEMEIDMKNIKQNSTVKTVLTVFLTLVGVAIIAGSIWFGMQLQKGLQSEVQANVKDVVSAIKVEQLKQ